MSDEGGSQRGVEERTAKRCVQLALQAIGHYNIGQRRAQSESARLREPIVPSFGKLRTRRGNRHVYGAAVSRPRSPVMPGDCHVARQRRAPRKDI